MNNREFIRQLKQVFVDNTGCNLQDNGKRPQIFVSTKRRKF